MLNGIHERGMNKDENIKVKIRKYPGASSIDILDHIKPSLRKAPEQIIIHAGMNDISNNTNDLKNDKTIVKLVKETCKDTKLSFSSVICRTDVKDITVTINTTNSHLEKGVCNDEKIILVEKEEVIRKDSKISGIFNNYFANMTDELGIYNWGNVPQNCLAITEKIKYFNNHPSIKTIKDKFKKSFSLKFEFVFDT